MFASLTVRRAIWIGTLVVNAPVFALLIGPLATFAWLVDHRIVSRDYNGFGLLVFLLSFIAAWAWWSVAVPRWRVWAYERVSDLPKLKQEAVAVGLTWPDGHVFGRTELKSRALRRKEAELCAKLADQSTVKPSQTDHGDDA